MTLAHSCDLNHELAKANKCSLKRGFLARDYRCFLFYLCYNIYMDILIGRGYVYGLEYHIVWCTKYRRKVLTGRIEERLHQILNEYATTNGFSIIEINGKPDHIHLLISATPQVYIPSILKGMKGVSARFLFNEFGEELKTKLYGGHLWNPSYFVQTVSDNVEENVRNYIRSQKEK